jgi:hypothetical protein
VPRIVSGTSPGVADFGAPETMAGILISRVVIATKTRNLVQVGFIGELSTTHLKLA